MTKIVIIDNKLYVPKNEALTSSFAPDVIPICYNEGITKDDVLGAVNGPVSSIAFMYHNPGYEVIPFFKNITAVSGTNGPFYQPKYFYFNDTFIDIIASLRDRNTSGEKFIVDILTCDLKSQEFKDEVTKVEADLGIDIRYSVDKTGNPTEGGNWVLESDGVNIKDLYFTDGVLEWKGLLTSDITAAVKAGTYSTYITWNAGTSTFTVQQSFSWGSFISVPGGSGDADSYITLAGGETFNGRGYTITITGYQNWRGLFASSGTSGSRPTITSLGIINGRTIEGFFVRASQGNFIINNCYSTGIINDAGGGIIGNNCGNLINITNCYSSGNFGTFAGGIIGRYCLQGYGSGTITISSCYSIGNMGDNAGGIIGGDCTGTGSTFINISNCYSTGVLGSGSGGITGFTCGFINGGINISNSYTTANNVGSSGGGILGSYNPSSGKITVTNIVANGYQYFGTGSNATTFTNYSSTLDDINNKLFSGWSSTFWESATSSYLGRLLPLLKGFKASPWNSSTYTIPTSQVALIAPSLQYLYTILGNGTASLTGYTGGLTPTGNLKFMYISGSTTNGTLSFVPSASAYQITDIAASAFSSATTLTGFAAPFVINIGASAFNGCTGLTYVYLGIPSGTPIFGTGCFNGCTSLQYIFKNINNPASWSPPVGIVKTYTPLFISPNTSLTSSTTFSIIPVTSGGTVQDNLIILTLTYTYIVNGSQTYTGATAVPLSLTTSNTYSIIGSNNFETTSAISTGQSQAITTYIYGSECKLINIGI